MTINKTGFPIAVLAAALFLLSGASKAHEVKSSDGQECMTIHKTGNADKDFMRNMIPHHQMAIDMAKKELEKGIDREARKMAEKVIEDQSKEIEHMEKWLKQEGK